MLISMTGFAYIEKKLKGYIISIEAKSLNNRYTEISLKIPPYFNRYEEEIRSLIKNYIKRGKIELGVYVYGSNIGELDVVVNTEIAKKYINRINKLKKALKLSGDIDINEIIKLDGVLKTNAIYKTTTLWEESYKLIKLALAKLHASRVEEGKNITEVLKESIKQMEEIFREIKKLAPSITRELKKQLERKVIELKIFPEKEKLLGELAIALSKTDIKEEMSRIDSHIKLLKSLLKAKEPVGKRIDFVCQEIHREISTLSVKSSSFEVSKKAVSIRNIIEQIREIARNVQ